MKKGLMLVALAGMCSSMHFSSNAVNLNDAVKLDTSVRDLKTTLSKNVPMVQTKVNAAKTNPIDGLEVGAPAAKSLMAMRKVLANLKPFIPESKALGKVGKTGKEIVKKLKEVDGELKKMIESFTAMEEISKAVKKAR